MKICKLLKKDHIFLDLEPGEKKQVLKEFVSALAKRGIISGEKAILRELLKREALCSTGLEKGIAVPHALTERVKEPLFALALIKRGMDFEAMDGIPTHVMLLILGNKDNPGLQLKILAHICRLIKETRFVEKVKKAKSSSDICEILKKEEEKI